MMSGSFWGCAAKEREKWTGNKEKVWLGIGKKEISHRVANLWVEGTEHLWNRVAWAQEFSCNLNYSLILYSKFSIEC